MRKTFINKRKGFEENKEDERHPFAKIRLFFRLSHEHRVNCVIIEMDKAH